MYNAALPAKLKAESVNPIAKAKVNGSVNV
jgi:hypothetical protein